MPAQTNSDEAARHTPQSPPAPPLEQEAEQVLEDVDAFAAGDTDAGPTNTPSR